jgi:CTP synthase
MISELGGTMRLGANPVILAEGSLPHKLYGSKEIKERHRHRWEVNQEYWDRLEKGGAVFPGWSPEIGLKEILWLPDHYFFMGTQFHPEFKSRPWDPSPPYYGFVKASLNKKRGEPHPKF